MKKISNKKFIIFGTGSVAEQKYKDIILNYGNGSVFCFIESMLSKVEFMNCPVIGLKDLKKIDRNKYMYVLGTLTSKKSMISELLKYGVDYNNIIIESDYGSDSFEANVKEVRNILLYPAIDSEEIIVKLTQSFNALVPNLGKLNSKPVIISNKNYKNQIFSIVNKVNYDEFDLVLVHNKHALSDENIKCIENIYCIDETYFRFIDTRILLRLNYLLEDNCKYEKKSINTFLDFKESHSKSISYVFGSGPTCREGVNISFEEDSIRIVCNNFVYNKELMRKIRPNVYVIADEDIVAYNGLELVKNIIEYVKKNNCILVAPDILAAVIICRCPDLSDKIVRVNFNTKKINFPTIENMSVYRKAYNVITAIAIPFASSCSKYIYISGCDGSDMKDINSGVWKHEEVLEDKTGTVDKHITNEKNWEKEYYIKHISYFSELLEYGEKLGKKYISYTNSYIPALAKRMRT